MKTLSPFVWLVVGCSLIATPAPAADTATSAPPVIPLTVAVDPRVELVSIIFRLAGHPEYSRCRVPPYAKDLDAQFAGARGFIDAIVYPEDTRAMLALTLRTALNNPGPHLGPYVLPARMQAGE